MSINADWVRNQILDLQADNEHLAAELAAAKANAEADQEVYHQVYMVLLNAGANKYLGAYEQAKALVARLAEAERDAERWRKASDAALLIYDAKARKIVQDFLEIWGMWGATDSADECLGCSSPTSCAKNGCAIKRQRVTDSEVKP